MSSRTARGPRRPSRPAARRRAPGARRWGLAGELLQHAPDFAAASVRHHDRVAPAQPAADRRETGVSGRGSAPGTSGSYAYSRWSAKWTKTTSGPPSPRAAPAHGLAAVLDDAAAHVPRGGQHRLGRLAVPSAGSRIRARRPPSAGRGAVHHISSPTAPRYSGRPSCEATSAASIGDGQAAVRGRGGRHVGSASGACGGCAQESRGRATSGRGRGRRSAGRRPGRVRRRRGRAPGSRSLGQLQRREAVAGDAEPGELLGVGAARHAVRHDVRAGVEVLEGLAHRGVRRRVDGCLERRSRGGGTPSRRAGR